MLLGSVSLLRFKDDWIVSLVNVQQSNDEIVDCDFFLFFISGSVVTGKQEQVSHFGDCRPATTTLSVPFP